MKNTLARALARINRQTKTSIYHQVLAQVQEQGGDLQVINNPASFSSLLKIYQRFINDADLRGLPRFMIAVDGMLQDFGGQPMAPEVQEEDEAEGEEGGDDKPEKPVQEQQQQGQPAPRKPVAPAAQ